MYKMKKGEEVSVFEPNKSLNVVDAIVCSKNNIKYSCLNGICGLCKSEVLKGKENIKYFKDHLYEDEIKDNEFMPCCCILKGDIEIKQS